VFHLQAGIDLEEGDRAVLANQEFAGAGAVVAGLFHDGLGRSVQLFDLLVAQEWRRCFLDQFLVSAL